MAYKITKSDGTLLLQLNDGQTDSVSSSITFVGRNVSRFGEIQNNDFLHLLENFADINSPAYPLTGQLWFDSAHGTLKVYNTKWQPLSVLEYSTASSVATSIGNLWYDSDYKQLFINTGTGFSLIGPEAVHGYGTTKLVSLTLKDITGGLHPVIEAVVNDEIIYVISGNNFTPSSDNLITGIPHIYKGINLKNGETPSENAFYFVGTSFYANQAKTLLNDGNTAYISASTSTTANTIVQRDSQGYVTAAGLHLGSVVVTQFDNDDLLSADSAQRLPTQHAVKAYVNSYVNAGVGSITGAISVPPVVSTIVQRDSNSRVWSDTSGTHYGNVIGNVTGNVTGDITSQNISAGAAATLGTITGNWSLTSGSRLQATYADLAENYLSDQRYEVGTVVMIGGEKEMTAAKTGSRAIGVISDSYAYLLNSGLAGSQAVGLVGRVPVKVIGSVNKGDRLIATDTGYATSGVGEVFAIALETNQDVALKIVEAIIL